VALSHPRQNSRLRNRFGAGEVWWNRFFRLDVVAVKSTADEQGWTKDRITKRGSNALPIRAARYRRIQQLGPAQVKTATYSVSMRLVLFVSRHTPITAAADRVPYGYRKPQRMLLHVKSFHTGSKCKPAKSRK
jgi:hypothetical protein